VRHGTQRRWTANCKYMQGLAILGVRYFHGRVGEKHDKMSMFAPGFDAISGGQFGTNYSRNQNSY